MLFWTGIKRISHEILSEQNDLIHKKIDTLKDIKFMVNECKSLFLQKKFNPKEFGEILHRGWDQKKVSQLNHK